MAETNPLTDSLQKILGTVADVGQTSTYTPPDLVADALKAAQVVYAPPAATAPAYTPPATPAAAAPPPDPYASFYNLGQRQQRQAMNRPQAALRRWGVTAPPAGYDRSTGAVAPATIPAAASPAAAAAPAAAPASSALPWQSYSQYYASNPAALNLGMYHTSATSAPQGAPSVAGQDPYRFGYEYNKYKEGLPLIYQDLINYGISPESVQSGQVTGLARGSGVDKVSADSAEMARIYGTKR